MTVAADLTMAMSVDVPGFPVIAVPARTWIVACGPSGSGKSVFCELLAGVREAADLESGVHLFGERLDKLSGQARARQISLAPSDPYLAFTGLKRTLGGELDMVQRLIQNERDEAPFLDRVVDELDLRDHLDRDPFTLSGGEAVRGALAMALVKRPRLLVLDQMYEQLDPQAQPIIQRRISKLLPAEAVVFETRSRGALISDSRDVSDNTTGGARRWTIKQRSLDAEGLERSHRAAPHPPPASSEAQPRCVLRAHALSYRYPNGGFSLSALDFEIDAGERVALVGPNGSGKSTLLKCLALLRRPEFDRLEIVRPDRTVCTPPPKRQGHLWARQALYCFQRPEDQLYLPSVREELAETARRLGDEDTLDLALDAATEFGLGPYLDRSPYDIPRSFRRLIPLAGALAVDPPVLLLDEPTVSLDDLQIAKLIERLHRRRPTGATVMISHDRDFLAEAVNRRLDIRDLQTHQGPSSKPA